MVDLIKLDNWPTSKRKGKAPYQRMSEIHSSNPDRMTCLNAGWEAFKKDNGMKVIPRSIAANPLMATHTPPITTRPLAASHPPISKDVQQNIETELARSIATFVSFVFLSFVTWQEEL